jgi:hypothetical protein
MSNSQQRTSQKEGQKVFEIDWSPNRKLKILKAKKVQNKLKNNQELHIF